MILNKTVDSCKKHAYSKRKIIQSKNEKTKNALFDLLIFLIQYSPVTKRLEILSAIIQSIQLISYAFESKFENCWKSTSLFPFFHKMFIYLKVIPFFRQEMHLYQIAFYFTIAVIVATAIFILILLIQQSKGSIKSIELAQRLTVLLMIITSFFFIPITETLVSIYECFLSEEEAILGQCDTNGNVAHIIIGTIALIVFLALSLIVINTIYALKYQGSPFSTKKTIQNDNFFFFNKCLIIGLNCIMSNNKKTIFLIGIICCFLIVQTYKYITMRCFHSFIIQKTYIIVSVILTWTYLILFLNNIAIGKYILGSIPLFWLLGLCLIIIGGIFIKQSINSSLLMKQNTQMSSADELIDQVEEIIDLIYSKANHRRSRIVLFGYIYSYNLRCIDTKNNPLKNYFTALNETKNINYFIFHLNDLLKFGLGKFPSNVRLRIYYALFIYEYLFRREQALKELEYTSGRFSLSFNETFFLYRLKKEIYIQLYPQLGDSTTLLLSNKESSITYKTLLFEFKHLISKLAYQYTEFWSILHQSYDNRSDLSKLNTIGIRIKKEVDAVHTIYDQVNQLKPFDQDIIFDYWYFVTNVLNDKEKGAQLVNQLKDIVTVTQTLDESNLCHIDLKKLFVNDDYPFIIFSAKPKSLGIITHISMQLCSLFGYNKNDLIGKQIEILLPMIFTQAHQRYLMTIVNYYKGKLYDNFSLFQNFKIEFKEQMTFVVNKAKYLLPVSSKATFFPNDDGNEYFYMKLIQDNSPSALPFRHHICYILTDLKLIIQNFTANAVTMLGLNSSYICDNKSITEHIRQLHEDYLKTVLAITNNYKGSHSLSSIELKHQLIHSKYANPTPITWIAIDNNNSNNDNDDTFNNNNSSANQIDDSNSYMFLSAKNFSIKSRRINNLENYMLIVHDYGHYGDNQGFIFQFEPISYYNMRQSSVSNYNPSSSNKVLPSLTMKDERKKSIFLNFNGDNGNSNSNNNKFDLRQLKIGSTSFSANNPLKVHKKFIPDVTVEFGLNPTTHMFYQALKVNKEEFLEQIRAQASMKTNSIRKNKTNSNSNSDSQSNSNSYTSSYTDDDSFTSVYSSSSRSGNSKTSKDNLINSDKNNSPNQVNNYYHWNTENNTYKRNTKCNINNTISSQDYYHVHTANIKYYLYDYKSHVIRETPIKTNKSSEVELRIAINPNPNCHSRQGPILTTLNPSESFLTTSATISTSPTSNEPSLQSRKEKVKQEIRKALRKDTIQSTIRILYILSGFAFIIAISKELIFMSHYILMIDKINDHIFLIRDSFRLHRNMILTMFCIRELTLVNTNDYIIPEEIERGLYIEKYYTLLLTYLKENIKVTKNITVTNIQFPTDLSDQLHFLSSPNNLINNTKNFSLNSYNNTFFSSVNALNNAHHNIISTDIKDLIPTNDNVFFFMFNMMNSIWLGVSHFNVFCILLFDIMAKGILWKVLLMFFGCEMMLVIIYLIARKGLVDASNQNASYLSIFFAIDKKDIFNLLRKCEMFTNHFKNNKIKDKYFKNEMHKDDEDREFNANVKNSTITYTHREIVKTSAYSVTKKHKEKDKYRGMDRDINSNNAYTNTDSQTRTHKYIEEEDKYVIDILKDNKQPSPTPFIQKKKNGNFTGLFLFAHVFLICGCIGVVIFDTVFLIQMIDFKKQIKMSIEIYESQVRLHRQSLLLFNLLRESVFEKNAYYKNYRLSKFLEKEITDIYNEIQKERQSIKKIIQNLSEAIYSFYFSLNSKCLCKLSREPKRCFNYTDMVGVYGLEDLVIYYIEEVRSLYYINYNARLMYTTFNFTYNYTVYGTDKYESYFPTDPAKLKTYQRISPMMSIFNSFAHEKLVYMYWSLINPAYTQLTAFLGNEIEVQCTSMRSYYLTGFGIMIGVILFLVFIIWFPLISLLSGNIYKTKNMLSIVSMEILVSLGNINKLLEINQDIDLYENH